MKNKTTKLILGIVLLGVIMISFAGASNYWACFAKGQVIHYCNNYKPNETYSSDLPYRCMSDHSKPLENCWVSGYPCLDAPKCNIGNNSGGNTTFDLTPPVLTVKSPLNGTISKSTKLFLNFSLNEVATVYYKDINKNTNTWIKVCDKCAVGNPTYAKLRSFSEGENNLMFKAVDLKNNIAYVNVKFLVDSLGPRIYTTTPKSGTYADGTFGVQFKENNPKKLTLTYGTDKTTLNLSKCTDSMGKKNCDTSVNLSKYNGQKIAYYFELEDISGNTYKSRPVNVSVDTKYPVVNNPSSFFKINGGYVDFNISITEDNFYKATFIKTNSATSTPTTLCTRLVNGRCTKHQSFARGNYTLSIQITDKAGHAIALPANFNIA